MPAWRMDAPLSESDPPTMPVDHPAAAPGAVRRIPSRTLTVALSFFITLGALLLLAPLLRMSTLLS